MGIAVSHALEPFTGSVSQAGQPEKNTGKDCVDELMRPILFNTCLLSDIQVACTCLAIKLYDSWEGTVLLSFWQRRGMLHFLILNAGRKILQKKRIVLGS